MDRVRFGLSVRALRRRRGWTQAQLAAKAGLSQAAISRVERGHGDTLTVATLAALAAELGARIVVRILADGENLDRLLDGAHAEIVERIAQMLRERGWEVAAEVTFSVFGERGSIDIFAFHQATGSLLVIEVKSTVPDVQATLAGIDRKTRLARGIARDRGWHATSVSRWLVLPGDATSRRRVALHDATFRSVLPGHTVAMRRWAEAPDGAVAGIVFVSPSTQARTRGQIRTPRPLSPAKTPPASTQAAR